MIKKVTKDSFKKWLEEFDTLDVVGTSQSGSMCPIANFYHVQGAESIEVSPDLVIFYPPDSSWLDNHKEHNLPPWAERFIYDVDASADYPKSISAQEALKILKNINRKED